MSWIVAAIIGAAFNVAYTYWRMVPSERYQCYKEEGILYKERFSPL